MRTYTLWLNLNGNYITNNIVFYCVADRYSVSIQTFYQMDILDFTRPTRLEIPIQTSLRAYFIITDFYVIPETWAIRFTVLYFYVEHYYNNNIDNTIFRFCYY